MLIDALTPSVMELVGRSLIRQGEIVMLVDTTGGPLADSTLRDVGRRGRAVPVVVGVPLDPRRTVTDANV